MLKLFLDDSGSKKIFSVGGWIAPENVWADVVDRWQTVLVEAWATEIPRPYHATDCEPRSGVGGGEYRAWTAERLLNLKRRLVPITHVLSAGVGRSVVLSDYRAALANHPTFRQIAPHAREFYPLFFCVWTALDWIASSWPDRPSGERVAIMFESGTEQIGTVAHTVFAWLLKTQDWARDVFEPTFANGTKATVELQVADMLAFEVFKDLDGRKSTPPRPQRKLLTELNRPGRLDIRSPNPGDYQDIIAQANAWFAAQREAGEDGFE